MNIYRELNNYLKLVKKLIFILIYTCTLNILFYFGYVFISVYFIFVITHMGLAQWFGSSARRSFNRKSPYIFFAQFTKFYFYIICGIFVAFWYQVCLFWQFKACNMFLTCRKKFAGYSISS